MVLVVPGLTVMLTDLYQIADRLCASIGQDILDCLFSRSTILYLSHRKPVCPQTARPFFFFTLSVVYVGKSVFIVLLTRVE